MVIRFKDIKIDRPKNVLIDDYNRQHKAKSFSLAFKGDQSLGRHETAEESLCHFGLSTQPLSPDGRFLIHQSGAGFTQSDFTYETTLYDLKAEAGAKFSPYQFLGWSRDRGGFYFWDHSKQELGFWESESYKTLSETHDEPVTRHILLSQATQNVIKTDILNGLKTSDIVHAENGLIIFLSKNTHIDVISLDHSWRISREVKDSITGFGTTCFSDSKNDDKAPLCTAYFQTEKLELEGQVSFENLSKPISSRLHIIHPDIDDREFNIFGWEPRFIGLETPESAIALLRHGEWRCPYRIGQNELPVPLIDNCQNDFETGTLSTKTGSIYLQDYNQKIYQLGLRNISSLRRQGKFKNDRIITDHLYQNGHNAIWQTHDIEGGVP